MTLAEPYAWNYFRLEEISTAASKEWSLEKALESMQEAWAEVLFVLIPYRESVSKLF